MSGRYKRKMSVNERMFVAMERLSPLINQMVFEGSGEIDLPQWAEAVEVASRANPGSRLVLRGALGSCRWIDSGITPGIREVDGSAWDGYGPEGAPFIEDRLDFVNGPSCEVLVIRGNSNPEGNPLRIIFRTHHGIMDGRGTFVWIDDIFRVLNGLKPVGSASPLTDTQLARSIQKKQRKPYPTVFIGPTGKAEGHEHGTVWLRRPVRSARFPNLLGQLAVILAEEAWKRGEGSVLMAIPVDMRRHRPDLCSTGNLTYSIYVLINPGDTPEKVTAEIHRQLRENYECMLTRGDELYRYAPLRLIARQARKIMDSRHANGLYSLSACLTNMGRISLDPYRGGGFKALDLWGIPPSMEYFPCFVGTLSTNDTLHVIITMPKVLANRNRLETLMNRLVSELKP
ncbi:MAG: hypothetical protein ACOY31_08525 [Bacillota bacterium]